MLNHRFTAIGVKHETAGDKYNQNFTVDRWGREVGLLLHGLMRQKAPEGSESYPRGFSRLTGGGAAALDRRG